MKEALDTVKKESLDKTIRNRDIINKIDEHVQRLRQRKTKGNILSPEKAIEETRKNLEQVFILAIRRNSLHYETRNEFTEKVHLAFFWVCFRDLNWLLEGQSPVM